MILLPEREPLPKPHQISGSEFIAARGASFLWDDMGLGKSRTVVRACDLVGARKILVVSPSAVRMGWAYEFLRWQRIERDITVVEGFPTRVPGDGVTIVSQASLADAPGQKRRRGDSREQQSWDWLAAGAPYDLVVLDEHHELRQYDAIRARNFWYQGGAHEWAPRVCALSGTPLVNSAADLWLPANGPLRHPSTWWEWCLRFCDMKQDPYEGRKPVGIRDPEGLAEFFRPHAIRRTVESVGIELPPLYLSSVELETDQPVLAQAMAMLEGWSEQRLLRALEEKDEIRDAAIARVRRALGVAKAYGAALHVHGMLTRGEGPVVVFFQHTDVRDMLWKMLSGQCGFRVSWIDGKVTRPQFAAAMDWFQAGRLDVLLVQTQAGGVGLTLHRANRCVVAELPWTSVALQQAVKRIHRMGQTRQCLAEVLRLRGCWLEDVLAGVVSRKQQASDRFLSLLTTSA